MSISILKRYQIFVYEQDYNCFASFLVLIFLPLKN
uniref:Uncharacterized protein n=1 Tax=Rhizophora mucronata TaxID=61149 RepID=A0A2P2R4K9_RHIMU